MLGVIINNDCGDNNADCLDSVSRKVNKCGIDVDVLLRLPSRGFCLFCVCSVGAEYDEFHLFLLFIFVEGVLED